MLVIPLLDRMWDVGRGSALLGTGFCLLTTEANDDDLAVMMMFLL
jgi:hypothetical protein